jgi:DNA-binding MarR family transcriptional regulator
MSLFYLVKQVELVVRARLDELVEPYGITTLQYTALTVLERHPGITSAELARNSFVRAQTTAQMVTMLEGLGLLSRERDEASKRQYRLTLTEAGHAIVHDLRGPAAELEHRMIEGLTSDTVATLRDGLRACRLALGGSHPH